MRARYMPWQITEGWAILDWQERELCRLPRKAEEGHTVWPLLQWNSRAAADAFLQNCYLQWSQWERDGAPAGAEVPKGWRPRPESNPFISGLQFPTPPKSNR